MAASITCNLSNLRFLSDLKVKWRFVTLLMKGPGRVPALSAQVLDRPLGLELSDTIVYEP